MLQRALHVQHMLSCRKELYVHVCSKQSTGVSVSITPNCPCILQCSTGLRGPFQVFQPQQLNVALMLNKRHRIWRHGSMTYRQEICLLLLDQLAWFACLLLHPPPHHCLRHFPHRHLCLQTNKQATSLISSEECHKQAAILGCISWLRFLGRYPCPSDTTSSRAASQRSTEGCCVHLRGHGHFSQQLLCCSAFDMHRGRQAHPHEPLHKATMHWACGV